LNLEDVGFVPEGMVITLPKSKTDQDGEGREVGICKDGKLCPVAALKAWVITRGIASGAVFRTVRKKGVGHRMRREAASQVVKKHAPSIGKNPAE